MAQVESMDVDNVVSDFDNKENSLRISNVLPKISREEKVHEDLDASELSMKLRYSITPTSSPMSQSYTANCKDSGPNSLSNTLILDNNLTRSLNVTVTKSDFLNSPKLPLQSLPTSIHSKTDIISCNREDNVVVHDTDHYENLSLPSTSSSAVQTPEATTPTKDIPKDEGSPIMRGLKSVLNLFRSSNSPVPPSEVDVCFENQYHPSNDHTHVSNNVEDLTLENFENVSIYENSNFETPSKEKTKTPINPQLVPSLLQDSTPTKNDQCNPVLASTPISNTKNRESKDSSMRYSPLKEGLLFNEDLEKELHWQDKTETSCKIDKAPIYQKLIQSGGLHNIVNANDSMEKLSTSVEYMDISNVDVSYKSILDSKTFNEMDNKVIKTEVPCIESDSEFLDCETTYTQNKLYIHRTEQIHKVLPVMIKTENIPHEASCLEEYIEPINQPNTNELINKKEAENFVTQFKEESETNNLISEKSLDDFNTLTGESTFIPLNSYKTSTDDTNKEIVLPTNMPSELPIRDHVTQHCYIVSTDNIIDCVPLNVEVINDKPAIETNSPDNSITNNMTLADITHDILNETKYPSINPENDNTNFQCKDLQNSNIELPTHSLNSNNKTTVKSEAVNTNSTNINMDESMLNKINVDSLISSNVESKNPTIISSLTVVSKSEEYLLHENRLTNNIADSIKADKFNETRVSQEKAEDFNTVNTSMNENVEVQKFDLKNVEYSESDRDIKSDDKCREHMPQDNENPLTDDNEHNTVGEIKNDEPLDFNTVNISMNENVEVQKFDFKNVEYSKSDRDIKSDDKCKEHIPQDKENPLTADNKHNTIGEIKNHKPLPCVGGNVIVSYLQNIEASHDLTMDSLEPILCNIKFQAEVNNTENCKEVEIEEHNLQSNNMTIPLDVSLRNDDVIEKDSLLHQLSTSMNMTSCLQDLHKNSKEAHSNTFPCSDYGNHLGDITTDTEAASAILPDVVFSVKKSDEDDLYAKETNADFTNEIIHLDKNIDAKVCDAEIIISANNSPHVSVSELNLNILTNVPNDPLETKVEQVGSPRTSPILPKKGYNINFDEIENPFATKTNVRLSPPPGVLNRPFTPVNDNNNTDVPRRPLNRRIFQTETKSIESSKKRFNKSVGKIKTTYSSKNNKSNNEVQNGGSETGQDQNVCNMHVKTNVADPTNEIIPPVKNEKCCIVSTENETPLTKFDENIMLAEQNFNDKPKGAIRIPDDINFNPFATKSRICVTPPLTELKDDTEVEPNKNGVRGLQLNTSISIESNLKDITNIEQQPNETDCENKVSSNSSNITISSINTEDKNTTVREVNTEDEDTIEGPFFEAEDLTEIVQKSHIGIDRGTIQFQDLPVTSNNDDAGRGELFIDAQTYEYLLNQNKSNTIVDSGKESLFLKFDPLFANRVSSDGVLPALSSNHKKQSTPIRTTRKPQQEETPILSLASPSNNNEVNNEEIISIVSKPMMIVSPAIAKQPVATPRTSLTPKTNRHSINFTSPALVAINRLLSLSGNTSLLDQEVSTDASSNHEANTVLVELRELLAEKELHVYSLKCQSNELKDRLTTFELKIRSLENEGEERLRKINALNECLAEKTKMNKSMAIVVDEYEKTIAGLIAEKELERKRNVEEKMRIISERDEQSAHLASMEASFNDVHSKYEKCKQILLSMKANEEAYKKSFKEYDENLLKMQKNYDLLKQHATSKLNHANSELEKINRAHNADVLKLKAIIKRKELDITSLEESLVQKSKANEELTAICDELINKVG